MEKKFQIQDTSSGSMPIKRNSLRIKANHRFRLVHFKTKFYSPLKSLKNSKCKLQVHSAGLLISGDFCENCKHISVLSKEIRSIELIRGKETIDTFYLSPMHLLSKLGLPISITRHFCFYPTEYKIAQTKIHIDAKEQQLELITSGYRFERLLRSFKKMGYCDKLKVELKPSIDLSDFKNVISGTENNTF